MHEVSGCAMEVGRKSLMQRLQSAHERLALSGRVDDALRETAFPDCDMRPRAWAMRAHETLGGKLTDGEKNHVLAALRLAEIKAAIRRGEQPSLSGIYWPDWSDLASDLDREAYRAWKTARSTRPKHEPFAIFRAHWRAKQGVADAELVPILRWALGEAKHDDTWGDPLRSAPKAVRTRMRNELIELLQQAEARLETVKLVRTRRGVRVGKPARELGAIVAAYAKVRGLGGLRGGWGKESDDAVRELRDAIEASEAWKTYQKS